MPKRTSTIKKDFSERIKNLRSKMGLSQKDFAKKLGFAEKTISTIENQRQLPTIPLITSLMKNFNISASWLLTGKGEMFINENDPGLSKVEYFKKAFPEVPAEPDVIDLIENMAVPIIKNAMIVKALELKSTYKDHILEYEQEKAREING